MDILHLPFQELDLNDPFFNSLKSDYIEFESWFKRKQSDDSRAFVMKSDTGLEAFLYLKTENDEIADVSPNLPPLKRLKVGTFKVNPHGTRLGERFIKKIFDYAIMYGYTQSYITVFEKHDYLVRLLTKYGFNQVGVKNTDNGQELVLLKDFELFIDDIYRDYPLFNINGNNKFILSVYPEYHTRLFPDSILNNETFDIIQDVSHTNSIHKVYICAMNVGVLQPKDLLLIYRTSDQVGRARFRSVVTSVCMVEEVRASNTFPNFANYMSYCKPYSVFSDEELLDLYRKRGTYVIKMTYNAAFSKRITRGYLLDNLGMNSSVYWGFMKLSDQEFNDIINRGGVNESLIINQA